MRWELEFCPERVTGRVSGSLGGYSDAISDAGRCGELRKFPPFFLLHVSGHFVGDIFRVRLKFAVFLSLFLQRARGINS